MGTETRRTGPRQDAAASLPRGKRLPAARLAQSREERAEAVQLEIFKAAGKVIGQVGYPAASIARITQRADMAQGTFYNYFASQEQLFSQLLPHLGKEMLARVQAERRPFDGEVDKERAGLRAFFDFLLDVPEFYRVLSEAETFAPEAHAVHTRNMIDGYLRSLGRARAKGHLDYSEQELEAISYMLIGIRHYLAMRYAYGDGGVHRVPDWVVDCYLTFLRRGLFSQEEARPERSAPPAPPPVAPRITYVGEGRATAEALLDRESALTGRSCGVISDLASMAALALANADGKGRHEVTTLSLHVLDPGLAGAIRAEAVVGARSKACLSAQVRITHAAADEADVAVAQVGLRLAR